MAGVSEAPVMIRLCCVEGCERLRQRGHRYYCSMHRSRMQRMGQVGPPGPLSLPPLSDRVLAKIAAGHNGCWQWTGQVDRVGYGMYGKPGRSPRTKMAHRLVYEFLVGPIPQGLTLDHLCRNRACVNPAHLEPVTNTVNVLRGESFSAVNARKTHCSNGHIFDAQNTGIRTDGHRYCRACKSKRDRQRWLRRMALCEVQQ